MWPSHSVSAKLSPGANSRTGFVAAPTLLVGGLCAIERCCDIAQRGDGVMKGGLVGFDLSDQMNAGGGGLLECFFCQCMASTVTTESVSASEPSKLWTAGISLDFSSQSRCASTRAESEAKALSMCAARRSRKLSKLRRKVLPSIAT